VDRQSLDVAAALTEAALAINSPRTLEETLDAIVHAARGSVPGFDHAGISVMHRGGRIETLAASDQLVWELDDLQYALQEGPCVEAMRESAVVTVEHARHDPRWPNYMPKAADAGLCAQLALRLFVDGETLGGLNLYSTQSETVEPEAHRVAELFASHAAIALGRVQREEQLNDALATRQIIGKAIGLTMARYHISEDRAFHFLVRASQTSNVKLREIAREVVETANQMYDQPTGRTTP
jgi:GAF domain-containing protein